MSFRDESNLIQIIFCATLETECMERNVKAISNTKKYFCMYDEMKMSQVFIGSDDKRLTKPKCHIFIFKDFNAFNTMVYN